MKDQPDIEVIAPAVDTREFVNLIRAAREDDVLHRRLIHLLRLKGSERHTLILAWAGELHQGGHEDLAQALTFFNDDKVAARALRDLEAARPDDNWKRRLLRTHLLVALGLILLLGMLLLVGVFTGDSGQADRARQVKEALEKRHQGN